MARVSKVWVRQADVYDICKYFLNISVIDLSRYIIKKSIESNRFGTRGMYIELSNAVKELIYTNRSRATITVVDFVHICLLSSCIGVYKEARHRVVLSDGMRRTPC